MGLAKLVNYKLKVCLFEQILSIYVWYVYVCSVLPPRVLPPIHSHLGAKKHYLDTGACVVPFFPVSSMALLLFWVVASCFCL